MLLLLKFARKLVNLLVYLYPGYSSFLFSIYWKLEAKIAHLENPPNPDYLDFLNAYLDGYVFVTVDWFIREKVNSITCEVLPAQTFRFRQVVENANFHFEFCAGEKEYDGENLWNIFDELFSETISFRKEISFHNMWYDKYRK